MSNFVSKIQCGHHNRYGYVLHVGHPVLNVLYNDFILVSGRKQYGCNTPERLAWEEVVIDYYSELYKKEYKTKFEKSSAMQWMRLAEIMEQSDIEAAKAAITAKAVEKLRKDDEIETSKALEAC